MATVALVDVSHSYDGGKTYAVKDVNVVWEDGVASALLGPSGCGKTTLLKIISGLLVPTHGQVLLDGEDVTRLSPTDRNIAQVFQFPVVYDTLSVYDNLAFPLRNRGVDKQTIAARVTYIAELLELTSVLKKNASRLGIAAKQRVSMGRGIIRSDTAAVLFDEPLTVIDPQQKWHLRRKLKELHRDLGLTMVYVTHDQQEALTFADQVTVMYDGAVMQTGAPQALHHTPQTPFVGYFIGSPGMNVLDVEKTAQGFRWGERMIPLPAGLSVPTAPSSPASNKSTSGTNTWQLGIRPEYVAVDVVGSAQNATQNLTSSWLAEVTRTTFIGSSTVLYVTLLPPSTAAKQSASPQSTPIRLTPTQPTSPQTLTAVVVEGHPASRLRAGSTCHVRFPEDKLMIYRQGQRWQAESVAA